MAFFTAPIIDMNENTMPTDAVSSFLLSFPMKNVSVTLYTAVTIITIIEGIAIFHSSG